LRKLRRYAFDQGCIDLVLAVAKYICAKNFQRETVLLPRRQQLNDRNGPPMFM
jgi:hypothetical protein